MNNLGYTPPAPKKGESNATPVTIVSDEDADRKPQYPSSRLNGEQAEKAGLDDCKYGGEYEALIRFRTTRIGGGQWEMDKDGKPPVEFDIIAMDEPKMVEASEEEEHPKRKPKQREVGPDQEWKDEYKGIDE